MEYTEFAYFLPAPGGSEDSFGFSAPLRWPPKERNYVPKQRGLFFHSGKPNPAQAGMFVSTKGRLLPCRAPRCRTKSVRPGRCWAEDVSPATRSDQLVRLSESLKDGSYENMTAEDIARVRGVLAMAKPLARSIVTSTQSRCRFRGQPDCQRKTYPPSQ